MADEREDEPTEPEPDLLAAAEPAGPQLGADGDAEAARGGTVEGEDAEGEKDGGDVHVRRNLTSSEKRMVDAADAAARALAGGGLSAVQQHLNALGALSPTRAFGETLASRQPAGLEALLQAANPGGQLRSAIEQVMPNAGARFVTAGLEARWGKSISDLQRTGIGTEEWRTAPIVASHLEALAASFQGSLSTTMGAAFANERWWSDVAERSGVAKGYQALIADLDPGWLGAATKAFDPAETYRDLLSRSTAEEAFARLGASGVVAERFASIISTIDLGADVDVVVARIGEQAPSAIDGAPLVTRRDMIAIGGYITVLAFSLLVLLHLTHPEVTEELSDLAGYAEIAVGAGVAVYKVLERRSESPAS
jgi:hypothetical protein